MVRGYWGVEYAVDGGYAVLGDVDARGGGVEVELEGGMLDTDEGLESCCCCG